VDLGEGLPVIEVRGVDDLPRVAELLGEGEAPVRQSLGVMEEQNLGHEGQSLALSEKHR
jgi:hypothetical protein